MFGRDVDQTERGKSYGTLGVTQIAERQGREGVERDRDDHHDDEIVMVGGVKGDRDRTDEGQHECHKGCGADSKRDETGGVDLHRVGVAFVVGEAENPVSMP